MGSGGLDPLILNFGARWRWGELNTTANAVHVSIEYVPILDLLMVWTHIGEKSTLNWENTSVFQRVV